MIEVETSQGVAALVDDPGLPGGQVLYIGGLASSHVDLKHPERLHMDYQARLGAALDALRARGAGLSVLHLGGGALALPRFVAATRPSVRQEVWEIEPELVALGRRSLGGRKLGLKCGDAADLITRFDHADVVIGDAFVGTATPPEMASASFVSEVRRVVGDDGLYLLNVVDAPRWDASVEHERRLRAAFESVAVFGAREVVSRRRAGNVLFAAGRFSFTALQRGVAAGRFPAVVR